MAANRDTTTAGYPSLQKRTVSFDNLISKLTGKKRKAWQPRSGTDYGQRRGTQKRVNPIKIG
ncbi:MAG: hypothetical protein ACJATI_004809 [Halioglobus sp.]|jgi:hypothetical protein|tara:strand:+ start:613 stop:798 length:186 start_codon:yes stop_codon:yes gene_type:complete